MTTGLNIAALAQRTGVAADTLRKWEQRYRILAPERTAGGQRRYSERDVARVEWLRERLDEGYRISEAASLLGNLRAPPARAAHEHLEAVLDVLASGAPEQVGLRLDQAFALLGVDEVVESVIRPLLREVGDRWEAGRLTVADEHLVSEAVRSRLGHLLADTGGGVRGSAVLACAAGEHHELGLMTAALAMRRDGWKVVYLGADTPLADVYALAERTGARVIGISVATAERAASLERELHRVGPPPEGPVLVLGGAGSSPQLAEAVGALDAGTDLAGAIERLRALSA
jgi:DNA-binding transcriptional MerR regulator/methylmalonyl-CoA mutase cobalamin-binding subunit